jgi:hypothetical protein
MIRVQVNTQLILHNDNNHKYLQADSIYLLIIQFKMPGDSTKKHNVTIEVKWQGPWGYLSAFDWPLLPFYALVYLFIIN